MLFQLTEHHFLGKNQRNFKKHKDKLNREVCILVLDFDGNYTFVIRNCATLSLEKFASGYSFLCFVLCDTDKETVCHKTFAGISNHMTHDTVAVYTFLLVLINKIIKPRYPFIKKITCFSDGSAAEYKKLDTS